MAKKTHVKVRMVPEAKPDSPFYYYVKKPAGGEKAKVKLSAKKYNPDTRKHEIFFQIRLVIFGSMPCFKDFALIFFNIKLILLLSTISFLNSLSFKTSSTSFVLYFISDNSLLSNLSSLTLIKSSFFLLFGDI